MSEVQSSNTKLRIDSLYFSKEAVTVQKLIEGMEHVRFADCTKLFAKGIFDIKSDTYVEDGIPFIRISDLRGGVVSDDRCAFTDDFSHAKEFKTALFRGDFVLSKTAYPAAAYIAVEECNVSQDVIAVRFKDEWKARIPSAYVTAFFNGRYGNVLLKRQFQGNVQEHLSLEDGKSIPIPLFSEIFAQKANAAFESAQEERNRAIDVLRGAEQTLLQALGLENWSPPEPLSYTRKSSEVWEAGRLDAEFFPPIYDALFDKIREGEFDRLGDCLTEPLRRGITPDYDEDGEVLVINSQHVSKDQVVLEGNRRAKRPAPSKDGVIYASRTGLVRKGDVLMNSTGYITIGRSQCLLEDVEAVVDNHVAIIRPKANLDPVYLACFLNGLPGKLQTERGFTGSSGQIELRPDVIADYLILIAPWETQMAIRRAVESGHAARRTAAGLLERAKRAVEIAIEQSEEAALAYLASRLA